MKSNFLKKIKRINLGVLISILAVIILVVTALTFSDALARAAWYKFRAPQTALALDWSNTKLAMEIGNYYFNGGAYDLTTAERAYKKAVSIEPKILWGHYQIARILFVYGKFDEALAEINKELEANPENLRSLYVRGLIYGYRVWPNDLLLAEADFRRFTLWAPSEWAGYNDLAWILSKEAKYQNAKDTTLAALSRATYGEQNPWLWNAKGLAELNLGEYQAAKESFEKALPLAEGLSLDDWRKSYPGKFYDNENQNAVIGFLCYNPLMFYVYQNIYKHLTNAEFIIGDAYDMNEYFTVSSSFPRLVEFFAKQDVYWRIFNRWDKSSSAEKFFRKYDILISPWYTCAIAAPFNKSKKLVRAMYGHAKDPWNYGLWSAYFDLILTYGQYSHEKLKLFETSVVVGNPKFDDWFSGSVKKEISRTNFARGKKKTILYMPTYGKLSSLALLYPALKKVAEEYYIIIKFHHNTSTHEHEFVARYADIQGIRLCDDRDDSLPLLAETDLVISDNSGAIFDAVIMDKPMVLIDFLDDETVNASSSNLYYREGGRSAGVVTDRDSFEQVIKVPGNEIAPILRISDDKREDFYEELKKVIVVGLEDENKFKIRRKAVRDLAFSFNDGFCGKRAAKAIRELHIHPKQEMNSMRMAVVRHAEFLDTWDPYRMLGRRYAMIRSLPLFLKLKALARNFF